jgi:hypothetical protein
MPKGLTKLLKRVVLEFVFRVSYLILNYELIITNYEVREFISIKNQQD